MSITLFINDRFRNRKVDFFNEFNFTLAYNSVASSFGFNYFFNPFNIEHKELSCVTHFHEVTVQFEGQQFLRGVITNQQFAQSSEKQLAKFGGYSLPGILEDVNIPLDIYPLQFDGLSLRRIAEKLIKPFERNYGLTMVIDPIVASKMEKAFKTTTASPTESIKDYLTKLASQKNIILSHTTEGQLLFTEAKTNQKPIMELDLTKPTPIGTSYKLSYDGQSMHSQITLQKQASSEAGNAGEFTIRNPYVINSVFRPKVMTQSSGDDNETAEAARRALGNELRGLKLTITVDRWVIDGNFILPNNTINVFAPELYLFTKKNWFIESVSYTGNNKSTTATLNCVLPEVYNTEPVESIFRNINLHALNE